MQKLGLWRVVVDNRWTLIRAPGQHMEAVDVESLFQYLSKLLGLFLFFELSFTCVLKFPRLGRCELLVTLNFKRLLHLYGARYHTTFYF